MKINIEFDLDSEEKNDKFEFNVVVKAKEMYFCLEAFNNYLREQCKYRDLTEEQDKYVEEIRTRFFEILEENNFSFGDIE
jgi:hypothetical protein